jgi:bifunctional UDP-N-acetylglucosamine pyrophosphorylase/glucosamine-1-phosphate N-acetyltransferase
MASDVPKALVQIAGKPMVEHLIESIHSAGVDSQPIMVVGHDMPKVTDSIGGACEYAIQKKQLGTGHALGSALTLLQDAEHVLVLNGDHPFISPETLHSLADSCASFSSPVTLMTLKLENFDGWNKQFYDFGRIIRNKEGRVERIVEKKDATEDELKITEVNPAYYCFNLSWLKENLDKIDNDNAQEEFYITDLVEIAMDQDQIIQTLVIEDPIEGIGVNTKEQLELAEKIFLERNK